MFTDSFADGRTIWARWWNDIVLRHAADLGGYEFLSEAQLSICKRAAALESQLESWEGHMSAGIPIDIELYARITGRLCRLLELIGIRRLARPVDPLSDLAKALDAYPPKPPPDDDDELDEDEPAPIEAGFDKTEPGEA